MDEQFIKICKKGKYYNPACNHYNKITTVRCDKCMRSNIVACIGYKELDLCLLCASAINDEHSDRVEIHD
jgi:hypothetical protein